MEIDATSVGIEDGSCQKMIQINQHRGNHDKPSPNPIFSKENKSNKPWS